MKITSFRIVGIRCFEDTGDILLSPSCNIFIGANNAGKSTLLKGILALQGFPFSNDYRPGSPSSFHSVVLKDVGSNEFLQNVSSRAATMRAVRSLRGSLPPFPPQIAIAGILNDQGIFSNVRPNHTIIPFIAKRKAPAFTHDIRSSTQAQVSGTFANLYSRVDLVATAGHPRHQDFQRAIDSIVGLKITTKATPDGKEAGFYLNDDTFVSLERMGDGVIEMVALIVELCLERDKIFVLEEPEANLHPNGLKALLGMIRSSLERNQFLISTHSNIVVRELAFDERTKLFRVWRDREDHSAPSSLEEVPRNPSAHAAVLRELGYEFTDFGLYEGWLFLEESSAETILNKILIPTFAPSLKGRLRSFSAGGITNVEPSIAEFQRLITFVHLEPVYEGRLWVRVDGDQNGQNVVAELRKKFPYLNDETCSCFGQPSFERYYPAAFAERVQEVLDTQDRQARRSAKMQLLQEVLQWTEQNGDAALQAWEESAAEPIAVLRLIESKLT